MRADCYTFDSDIYCEDCAPKGSQPAFQVETDSPSHCAECHELLDCALTPDGYRYVADALIESVRSNRGDPAVLRSWLDAYPDALRELEPDEIQELAEAHLNARRSVALALEVTAQQHPEWCKPYPEAPHA